MRSARLRLVTMVLQLSLVASSGAQWERHGPFVAYPGVGSFAKSGVRLFCGGFFYNDPDALPGDGHSIYCSTDNGITWIVSDSGITSEYGIGGLAVHGTTLFAGGYSCIYRSTNDGESWTPLSQMAWTPMSQKGRPIVLNDTSLYTILSTYSSESSELYQSTDDGTSWTKTGGRIPGVYMAPFTWHNGSLFAGGEMGLYRSTDNGGNWTACNTGLANWYGGPQRITALASSGTRLFAGTWGYGLYVSENDGNRWKLSNFLSGYVSTIAVHGSDIYVADDGPIGGGVFHSTDNGITWVNRGLVTLDVNVLFVYGDYLFAGTDVNNMYRAPLSSLVGVKASPAEVVAEFGLEQNYPNPFNPSTRIKYTVGGAGVSGLGASKTSLIVYDFLGREVAVLVNERKATGSYEVNFNAAGLASGIYFYRLQSGSQTLSRKMVILR